MRSLLLPLLLLAATVTVPSVDAATCTAQQYNCPQIQTQKKKQQTTPTMLKLKRTFSSYAQDDSQSMESCTDNEPTSQEASSSSSPMQVNDDSDSRPSKRQRQLQKIIQQQQQQPLQQLQQQGNLQSLVNNAKQQQQHSLQKEKPSQFASAESIGLAPAELIATYKRQKYRKPKDQKILFSEDDVRELLQYQEQVLRQQYDNILRDRLQEQFANFSQFSQDCIYRQFSNRDFSYTS